jgi:hypothetical protein
MDNNENNHHGLELLTTHACVFGLEDPVVFQYFDYTRQQDFGT